MSTDNPPDNLQPNYLTVNPDGTIGADFTGKIQAQGIIFSSVEPTDQTSEIQWIPANGARVAVIGAYKAGNQTTVFMSAADADGVQSAFNAGRDPTTDINNQAAVSIQNADRTESYFKHIIRGDGASDFLQLAGGAEQLELAIGTVALAFAASQSANAVITHDLGRVPQWFAAFRQGNPTRDMTLGIDTLTATQMTLHGWTDTAASINPTFVWAAIG